MDHQIAMLWMRGSLSFLEQLCVQSFLDAGHHVVLFSYEEIGKVPDGVERRYAGEVLPERADIVHSKSGSPAPHADLFRYRLLAREDRMIWADTDAYCRFPFRTETGHFFGWESEKEVNIGVLGLPKDSQTLAMLVEFTSDEYAIPYFLDPSYVAELGAAKSAGKPVHVGDQVWAVWGPKAFTHFLKESGEVHFALPQVALYPYSFRDRRKLVQSAVDHSGVITDETQSIHLYGRRIRKRLAEREHGLPPVDSLIGSLLLKHKIDPCEAPLRDYPNPDRDSYAARMYREAMVGKQYSSAGVETTAVRPTDDSPMRPPETASDVFPIREDTPAIGMAAEQSFLGLMNRTQARNGRLVPLATPDKCDEIVVVTSMKNEGCFILEWIAYHLSIGVTHFVVYTNDCSDPTNEILDRLQVLGYVTRIDNPYNPQSRQKPQRAALNHAVGLDQVKNADWVSVIDVDEFVNIHVGDGTFRELIAAAHDPNVISMTWRFFGNVGVERYEDRFQTEIFTRCAPRLIPKPRLGWGFKSFFRADAPFRKLGVHRPLDLDASRVGDVRWVNGAGVKMPERLLNKDEWFSRKDSIGYDLVTLNHYVLRSAESFLVKRDRGRVNHVDQDQGVFYWASRNYRTETDASIQRHLDRTRQVHADLLGDVKLAEFHEKAVAWHRERIDQLMQVPEQLELYKAITNQDIPDAIWRKPERKG